MPTVRQESAAAVALAARPPVQRGAGTSSALVASGLTTGSPFVGSAQMRPTPDLILRMKKRRNERSFR